MKKLLFIRHGESEANKLEICAGHTDVKLTRFGQEQARKAGQQLKNSQERIDLIISSPLIRAYETAQIIAREIGYAEDRILKTDLAVERYRGRLEGKPSSLQDGMTPEEFIDNGAESEEAMSRRAEKLGQLLKSKTEKTILLVSHNQFGMAFIGYLDQVPVETIKKLPNASVIDLTRDILA